MAERFLPNEESTKPNVPDSISVPIQFDSGDFTELDPIIEAPANVSLGGLAKHLNRFRKIRHKTDNGSEELDVVPDVELTEKLELYADSDEMEFETLPKVVDLDLSSRDIKVKTKSGEEVSEAEYLTRFIDDLADNPEFREKLQWMGEAELVKALAEQAQWLAGRVIAGETVLVMEESWHRKDTKSGGYLTDLIVNTARDVIFSIQALSKSNGEIITDGDLRDGKTASVDRVLLFDDWIGSGHDMGQRINWVKDFLMKNNIDSSALSINLLAAHTTLLESGFDGYFTEAQKENPTRVIAPFEIDDKTQYHFPPFSGVHSDMDYSFTLLKEMHQAVDKRNASEWVGKSSYEIESVDTLGNAQFYDRIKNQVAGQCGVAPKL